MKKIAKLAKIVNLDTEIAELTSENQELKSQNNDLQRMNDSLISHFGNAITYANLQEKVTELQEQHDRLMGRNMELKDVNKKLGDEVTAMERSKEYLESGMFMRDLTVEQLRNRFTKGVGSLNQMPLAKAKYLRLKVVSSEGPKQDHGMDLRADRVPVNPQLASGIRRRATPRLVKSSLH